MINKNWIKLNFFYFSSIALIGCLIRVGFFTGNFITEYKHLLHTHSHIGFLGWVYPSLFLLIINSFLDEERIEKGKYKLQFYITQILIILMLISFLNQGYGFFSILFSSLFQLMTYWFTIRFFSDSKSKVQSKNFSLKFVRIALLSLFISSFGTWALPIITIKGLASTNWYHFAIYFYLHFQYNGWILFSILGLVLKLLENNNIEYKKNLSNTSFNMFSIALVPAYFLSILGDNLGTLPELVSYITVTIQFIGMCIFLLLLFDKKEKVIQLFPSLTLKLIFISGISSFILKIFLQALSTIETLREIAFANRYIILSYLHLTLIGFTSMFLILLLEKNNYIELESKTSRIAIYNFFIGFTFSEFFLVFAGLGFYIPNITTIILGFSIIMALGIFLIFISQLKINSES